VRGAGALPPVRQDLDSVPVYAARVAEADQHAPDIQAHLRFSCIECGRRVAGDAHGWLAFRVDDPDIVAAPELTFYCPACATREFGD